MATDALAWHESPKGLPLGNTEYVLGKRVFWRAGRLGGSILRQFERANSCRKWLRALSALNRNVDNITGAPTLSSSSSPCTAPARK